VIARLHNGSIKLDGEAQGARFVVRLPAADPPAV
jgi:signal transduction histidine kinase